MCCSKGPVQRTCTQSLSRLFTKWYSKQCACLWNDLFEAMLSRDPALVFHYSSSSFHLSDLMRSWLAVLFSVSGKEVMRSAYATFQFTDSLVWSSFPLPCAHRILPLVFHQTPLFIHASAILKFGSCQPFTLSAHFLYPRILTIFLFLMAIQAFLTVVLWTFLCKLFHFIGYSFIRI